MMIQMIRNNEVVLVRVSTVRSIGSCFYVYNFIADFPQKRVDRQRSNGQTPGSAGHRTNTIGQLTEGSPLVSRRKLYSNVR